MSRPAGTARRAFGRLVAQLTTFVAVAISWVLFRAETLDGALRVYSGMAGVNGISLPVAVKDRLGEFAVVLAEHGVVYHGLGSFGDNMGIVLLALIQSGPRRALLART